MNADELRSNLNQFFGSETFYRHWLRCLTYTEGVQYLAEQAGAYWLIDAIASYQPKVRTYPFQVWTLEAKDSQAVLTMAEDSNRKPLVKQAIEYTDFPLESIKLYVADGVLMLPNEY